MNKPSQHQLPEDATSGSNPNARECSNALHQMVEYIQDFRDNSDRLEWTDVGAAWDLFDYLEGEMYSLAGDLERLHDEHSLRRLRWRK